jgi:hypothetical protein
VVLNEVLANEPGGNTTLEWVELFNYDSQPVNLAGWRFIEEEDTTILSNQAVVASKGYLVLARKLVAPPPETNSFEAVWGDGSSVWGDSPDENFPAIEAKLSLTNSAGTVSLISPDDSVQTFSWSSDAGDGISWEKVYYLSGDEADNWASCVLPEGSTPGKVNSVAEVANDLAVERIYALPDNPGPNTEFDLLVDIRNLGSGKSQPSTLAVFDDLNFNQRLDANESLGVSALPQLGSDQLHTVGTSLSLPPGNHRIIAHIADDDKNYNNQSALNLKVGQSLPEIVINEIMAAPDLSQDQTEWVELYNRSDQSVNLKDWRFGDAKQQAVFTEDLLELSAGGFLILADDRNKFLASYPDFSASLIQPTSWQALDNDGDEIVLMNSLGFVVERVTYPNQSLKGVSRERIDHERSANDGDNWWRSVDSSGATPGRQNSVQVIFSTSVNVRIDPNPFSPDDDGFEDRTEIEFEIPLGVDLTMKIYDRKGRLARTLFDNQAQVSGKVSWDGRKDNGEKVRSGLYILLVETKGEHRQVRKESIAVIKQP